MKGTKSYFYKEPKHRTQNTKAKTDKLFVIHGIIFNFEKLKKNKILSNKSIKNQYFMPYSLFFKNISRTLYIQKYFILRCVMNTCVKQSNNFKN